MRESLPAEAGRKTGRRPEEEEKMNKLDVILKKDFETGSWKELQALLNGPSKTTIGYKSGKDKVNLASRLNVMILPLLFAFCVISLALPVAEYMWLDAPGFLALTVLDALFMVFFERFEDVFIKASWLFVVGIFISFYHYIILAAQFNLFITWVLLTLWGWYAGKICRTKMLESESNFTEIWMNNIESINVGDTEYTHKTTEEDIERALRRSEILEKDKQRLTYFDMEFMSRFGMYTNPKTGENIMGAQDYYEALEAMNDEEVPDRGKLTSTELDELFSRRFSTIYRKIRGMKDYLTTFDEQQREMSMAANESYSRPSRSPVMDDDDDEEEERHDKEYYFNQLNSLIGLDNIKSDVKELINLVQMQKYRRENGLKDLPISLHLVFLGNPGTGKTSVARILANLYREIGVLEKGQLVETDRSDLVAGYVGQTALKTKEKIEEAMGGVLFIDEAYTLNKEGNDFGQEAIDTILKAMEDYRDKFIVIVAGYPDLMESFINSNPGLKSRFNKYFNFPDYSGDELFSIFQKLCSDYDYLIEPSAEQLIRIRIIGMERNKGRNFANAREIRNMFERIIANQASRVMSTEGLSDEDMMTITEEDM